MQTKEAVVYGLSWAAKVLFTPGYMVISAFISNQIRRPTTTNPKPVQRTHPLDSVSWNHIWYPVLYQRYSRHNIKLGVYLRYLTLFGGGKISVQLFFTVWCWPWTFCAGAVKGKHEPGSEWGGSWNIWIPWGMRWNLWLSLHLRTVSLDELKEIPVFSLQGHSTLGCWKGSHESWSCRRPCYCPCQQGELADRQNTCELKQAEFHLSVSNHGECFTSIFQISCSFLPWL